jgi:S1-C subfamily serine protease
MDKYERSSISQHDCVDLKKDGVRYCGVGPRGEEAKTQIDPTTFRLNDVWCFHAKNETITRDIFDVCTTTKGGRRVSEKFARIVNPNLVERYKPSKTPIPAVAASPEKSQGAIAQGPSASSRELVTAVQNLLNALGYFSGPINGVAGSKTRSAIREFQRHSGLPVDGQVSETLLNRLTQALRTAAASPPSQPLESPPKLVGTGTGFVVNGAGYVLTNYHVVDGCQTLRSLWSGVAKEATLIASDRGNDLALLKQRIAGTGVAHFHAGRNVRSGDNVVVVGFPLRGLLASQSNLTTGTISATAGLRDDTRYFQITAPVQPGNSGGPLLDHSGHIIGVVVSKLDALKLAELTGDIPQNVNFAIKASVAQTFLDTHSVEYLTSISTTKLDAADIGEQAREFTVLIECWK